MKYANAGLRALLSGAALSILAGAAAAQTAPQEPAPDATTVEDIVVTGTLVRGVAPTGTQVVGLSEEQIVATGAMSVNQVLASVPQVSNAFNQIPAVPNLAGTVAAVRPNLRGLSSGSGSATLILVDGHRLVNAGILDAAPDPDVIPPGVLQRVDVVPDGGSSIYGSDAVGGVINFITRKTIDGVDISGRYGFADNYQQYDLNLTAGRVWEGGGAYLSYAHVEHDPIFGRDRDYVRDVEASRGSCVPGTVTVTRGGVATTYALPGRTPGTAAQCDTTDNLSIYPSEVRNSVFGRVNQDVSDALSLDVTGFYTERKTTSYFDLRALGSTSTFGQSGTITSANPYYVPIAPDPGSQTVAFSYAGVFDDATPIELQEYGLTPTATLRLGGDWQLRVLGNYGVSKTESHSFAIDAAAQAAALAGTTTATALNPYDVAATNPTVLAGIRRDAYGYARQELINGRVIADGTLVSIAGGDIKAAVGVEYSHEEYSALYGTIPLGRTDLAGRGVAKREVMSVFGEVVAPLVSDANAMPGVQALTLSLSARYDDYSDFGGTTNPKVGLTYKPVDWITARANYGTSFNAPSLADTEGASDSRAIILPVSPFRDPADPVLPNLLRPTVALAGGNPNLKPQEADTWSVGFDVRPPVVDGLTLSLTYFNIAFVNQISRIPAETPAVFTPAYSSFIIRNPTLAQLQAAVGNLRLDGGTSLAALYGGPFGGPYVLLDLRRNNLGTVDLDGLDFNVKYERDTNFGEIFASVGGTYQLNREIAPIAGGVKIDALDSPGQSRLSLIGQAGLTRGQLTASARVNYSDGYDLTPAVSQPATGAQTEVGSFTTVDLFASYALEGDGLMSDVNLTLGVSNLFDEDPPYYNSRPGYTNGGTLGRLFQIGFSKSF